jgi:hypothetical protein
MIDKTIQRSKENDKSTNNDLQNSTQKTEEKKIQTPQGTGDNLRCSEKVFN